MCRLVAYLGHEVLLEDVLVKPFNSIVMQSLHARESSNLTNGDGFGVGWYVPEISPTPALFTSISPAWNDNNLLHLTAKIKSPCFFAHVRAASAGGVTHYNCHPFLFNEWMFMHNGSMENFLAIKRHLRHLLDDDIYNSIQGETDSEHLFALFLQFCKGKDLTNIKVVADILQATIYKTNELIDKFIGPKHEPSYFNFCLTNGKQIWATRYCSDEKALPETMYYSVGKEFIAKDGRYHMLHNDGPSGSLLIASEKLTKFHTEWHDIPPNHLVMVDLDLSIQLRPL